MRSFSERFWDKVNKGADGECWEWKIGFRRGYGVFGVDGKSRAAHRVAWELSYGPIPDGLFVCHHCDNRPCCNPSHLFLGTCADNHADRNRKGRQAKGLRNGNARISDRDVLAIRESKATQKETARLWGVSQAYVSYVRRGLVR